MKHAIEKLLACNEIFDPNMHRVWTTESQDSSVLGKLQVAYFCSGIQRQSFMISLKAVVLLDWSVICQEDTGRALGSWLDCSSSVDLGLVLGTAQVALQDWRRLGGTDCFLLEPGRPSHSQHHRVPCKCEVGAAPPRYQMLLSTSSPQNSPKPLKLQSAIKRYFCCGT